MAKGNGGGGLFHGGGNREGKGDGRTSAPQNTAVGSGSRPTRSKIAIDESAPADDKISVRDVPGSLK